MIPALLRHELGSWLRLGRKPVEPTPAEIHRALVATGLIAPSLPRCPEPGCPVTGEAEDVFLHAFRDHGRDRRKVARR